MPRAPARTRTRKSSRTTPDVQEAEQVRRLVRRIHAHMDRVRAERERSGGLTRLQSRILEALFHRPGLSLKELKEALHLSHSTLSEVMGRMEQAGTVRREPDPEDGRVTRHFVSEHVLQYIRAHVPQELSSPLARALARATPAQREHIRDTLTLLLSLLEADAAGEEAP